MVWPNDRGDFGHHRFIIFSNSTGSFVTNRRFSPIMGLAPTHIWPRMFYEHTLYSLWPPTETGILLILLWPQHKRVGTSRIASHREWCGNGFNFLLCYSLLVLHINQLFSPSNISRLVLHESVKVLCKCRILHNMIFGFTCCVVEVSQENYLFWCKTPLCIHKVATYVSKNNFIEELCSQCQTTWNLRKHAYDDVYTISHTTKVSISYLMMMFVDVGNNILLNSFIKDCMFITSTTEIYGGCSTIKFWYHSGIFTCLTIRVGRSSISFPPIGPIVQLWTQMIFSTPCQIHQLNHVVICINNPFYYCQLHIFFKKRFFTSKIQRRDEPSQFISCFFSFPIFHVHHRCQHLHSNLYVKFWTSFNCFI